jgi:DNA-binding GntR family transcriptional regulator
MSLASIEKPTENKFIPIYYQIANFLHRKIEQRELKPGGKPPNEMNLAKMLDISRVTLRQALSLLEGDDLLVRERRNRAFVKKSINKNNRSISLESSRRKTSTKKTDAPFQ